MARFYVDLPLAPEQYYSLPADVIQHLHVLRLRENTTITLFNGNGNDYPARLLKLSRREAQVVIEGCQDLTNESQLDLSLYLSLIANDKFDLVVQKAVELGVTRIIPVVTSYTQRIKAEKISTRSQHWRKIILAASEQCGRARLTEIGLPVPLAQVISQCTATYKFILSPHHHTLVPTVGEVSGNIAASLLVGPEGGFTPLEVAAATDYGFMCLQLGPRILRAETAAISGLAWVQARYGDLT